MTVLTPPNPILKGTSEFKRSKNNITSIYVQILPTPEQKTIILNWMDRFIEMYNKALYFIKRYYFSNKKYFINFQDLRDRLHQERETILMKCLPRKKCPIYLMDEAVSLACANYKSATSNLRAGNIKSFRIRYWKLNKDKKILKLEGERFSKVSSSFCAQTIGKHVKAEYEGKSFNLANIYHIYKTTCTLLYDYNTKKFNLFVPIYFNTRSELLSILPSPKYKLKEFVEENGKQTLSEVGKQIFTNPAVTSALSDERKNKVMELAKDIQLYKRIEYKTKSYIPKPKPSRKFISLDPGSGTFLTGISENEVIKVGEGIGKKIRERLNKLVRLKVLSFRKFNESTRVSSNYKIILPKVGTTININKTHGIPAKAAIQKLEARERRKISFLVDELHWKSINYLTSKYQTILIGNLSAKSCVKKETSKLNKFNKKLLLTLSFYKFKCRLREKCRELNIGYREVDEGCTTRMCSVCGGETTT